MCTPRAMELPAHHLFCCYLRGDYRDEPAQETADDGLCPRRLSELQLSSILFQAVKLKWSQVQQKRFSRGHRKTGRSRTKCRTFTCRATHVMEETIVEQLFLGRRC